MKFLGNLSCPRKFSSGKYDMMCAVCFQKFIVSCTRMLLALVQQSFVAIFAAGYGVPCRLTT